MSDRKRQPDTSTARRACALLQVWLSPAFPIGAYAYSHGLEKVVEHGWVNDRSSLEAWVLDLSDHGSLRNDLVLLAAAYAAVNDAALRYVADVSSALQPSAERALEATQQGASFLQQIDTTWPVAGLSLADRFTGTTPALAVVLGAAACRHDVPLGDVLVAHGVAFVSSLVSAAIRLGVIGQTDGQRIIATLLPVVLDQAQALLHATLDDLGGAAFRSDIASMQHETQYTRLFRS